MKLIVQLQPWMQCVLQVKARRKRLALLILCCACTVLSGALDGIQPPTCSILSGHPIGVRKLDVTVIDHAEKRSKQRGKKKMGFPIDKCGPLKTPAEEALFFMVYQDPACKSSDGSDNFLVMSGKFNCHYSSQASHDPKHQVLSALSWLWQCTIKEPRCFPNTSLVT